MNDDRRCLVSFYVGITVVQCLVLLGLWSGVLQEWWPCVVIMGVETLLPYLDSLFAGISEGLIASGITSMVSRWIEMLATLIGHPVLYSGAILSIDALVTLLEYLAQYSGAILSIGVAYLVVGALAPFPASIQLSRPDEEAPDEIWCDEGPLYLLKPSASNGYALYTRA